MPLRIVAVVCARNEELHIKTCLDGFRSEDIPVVVVDHESTDRTRAIARSRLGRGVLAVETLPWSGSFSLLGQLSAKARIAAELDADWIIHADADEWLQAPSGFGSLREGITRAHHAGYNCINFEEFTFVPVGSERYEGLPYRRRMLRYYFFEPRQQRLMRAWLKEAQLTNIDTGGHVLKGMAVRVFPKPFILRHYIVLSRRHAIRKYVRRIFDEADLKRGWHGNRLGISSARLRVKDFPWLKHLPHPDSREFDRSAPQRLHFWDWRVAAR